MRCWICSLEASPSRLCLTLASLGSDRMPVPLERKCWKASVRPKTVLRLLARWERVYEARIERIVLSSLQMPADLLRALGSGYRLAAVNGLHLREVLEAWRREVTHRWRRSEWLCLLGQGPGDEQLPPYTWVLARLRSQARSLDGFLEEGPVFEQDGDMVYVSWPR